MKLIFIGPQGSGKGTQAKVLSEKINVPHISTGDLLRNAQGKIKEEIENCTHRGDLVPDELIINILKERITQPDCKNGFILDGFPRNLPQAKELDKITKIDAVIEIEISDEEAIKRIGSRISCPKCGSVFNLNTNPPKKKDHCDKCNSLLIKRKDDTEEAIKQRLRIYHHETEPILEHYDSIKINGEQPIDIVTEDILSELKQIPIIQG